MKKIIFMIFVLMETVYCFAQTFPDREMYHDCPDELVYSHPVITSYKDNTNYFSVSSLTTATNVLEISLINIIEMDEISDNQTNIRIFGYAENKETKEELFRKLKYFLQDFINEHPNLKVYK